MLEARERDEEETEITISIYLLVFWRPDLVGFEAALCCQNTEG